MMESKTQKQQRQVMTLDTLEKKERNDHWSRQLMAIGEKKDEQAFAELFNHFAPLLKGFLINSAPNQTASEIEEIIQEAMCKVWLKAHSYDPLKSAASTWIYTVARNTRIDFIRKHSRHDSTAAETYNELSADDIWEVSDDNQPFVLLNQAREKNEVNTLLATLPDEQQLCLNKMYIEGKTHTQLAEELGLPLGTVKSRIRLGLRRLQASHSLTKGSKQP